MWLSMSLSNLRPKITEEVELTIAVETHATPAGDIIRILPPKYTRVTLEQRGRGAFAPPLVLEFPPGVDVLTQRLVPSQAGAIELRAHATLRDLSVTSIHPPTITIHGRIPDAYITPRLPSPEPGPCMTSPATAPPPSSGVHWRNWHGNISKDVQVVSPATLGELVASVRAVEAAGGRIGVEGSAWSFSDCVVGNNTTVVLRTQRLSARIEDVLAVALRPDLAAEASRYVHVEAGLKIHDLNCLLDRVGLAMPTLGGSRGQSIGGVLSTGVHGADVEEPPIADAVQAIHLVGPGGQEWWIEPETDAITSPLAMARLRESGVLCPHLRIVYSDDLFNSVLVSIGCAGVIYSVVLKARPAFHVRTETQSISWRDAQDYINGRIVPGRSLPRFVEINVNAADQSCLLTERTESASDAGTAEAPSTPPDIGAIAVAVGLLGPGALGAFFAAIGDYVRRVTGELTALSLIPPPFNFIAAGHTLKEALDTVQEAHRVLAGLHVAAVHPHDDEQIARLLPDVINLIWKIGAFVIDGKEIVDRLQAQITRGQRPPGVSVRPSYVAMTGQPPCPADPSTAYDGSQTHPATERLVESFEYALSSERAVAFVSRVCELVQELRRGADALIVNINLRFTQRSRALLAMQQFERTCHVEIYTLRGIAGNSAFHKRMFEVVREFQALPHWGQLHDPEVDASTLWGGHLAIWQWAMNFIATNSPGTSDLFWTSFARERGLLNFTPNPGRLHPALWRRGRSVP
jgi:FAD/FMN-containing dehydrogenase